MTFVILAGTTQSFDSWLLAVIGRELLLRVLRNCILSRSFDGE